MELDNFVAEKRVSCSTFWFFIFLFLIIHVIKNPTGFAQNHITLLINEQSEIKVGCVSCWFLNIQEKKEDYFEQRLM